MSIFTKHLLAIKVRPKSFGVITALNDGARPRMGQMVNHDGMPLAWFIRPIDELFGKGYYVTQDTLEQDYDLVADSPGFLIVEKR